MISNDHTGKMTIIDSFYLTFLASNGENEIQKYDLLNADKHG